MFWKGMIFFFGLEGWLKKVGRLMTSEFLEESWEVEGFPRQLNGSWLVLMLCFFCFSSFQHGRMVPPQKKHHFSTTWWQGASKDLWSDDKQKWFLG